jgi:hypothetical protein
VAVRYIHRFPNIPDSRASAKERAGFIEAYYIDVKKNMSKPTMRPPIASPPKPFKPFVWRTTVKMTAISKAESKISTVNINSRG